jgi:hypothetical protein
MLSSRPHSPVCGELAGEVFLLIGTIRGKAKYSFSDESHLHNFPKGQAALTLFRSIPLQYTDRPVG